jgi:hypothetical protein
MHIGVAKPRTLLLGSASARSRHLTYSYPHPRWITRCTTGSLSPKRNLESTPYLELLLF